jgi:hypothetical protein
MLLQIHPGPNGKDLLRPIAFFLKRIVLVECNYDIYNKELLAIVYYLKE